MHIVTDSGCDLNLTAAEQKDLNIHVVPLTVTLGNESFQEGPQLDAASFYTKLDTGGILPTTSQPSAGMFANTPGPIMNKFTHSPRRAGRTPPGHHLASSGAETSGPLQLLSLSFIAATCPGANGPPESMRNAG